MNNNENDFLFACKNGHLLDVISLVDDVCIDMQNINGYTALMQASWYGHITIVDFLIKKGADVNLRSNNGWSPLMCALYHRNTDVASHLIKNKSNLNIQDKNGLTSLMHAVHEGDYKSVENLTNNMAILDIQDNEGRTALIRATQFSKVKITEKLIKSGANIDIKDNNGLTAYDYAARNIQIIFLFNPDIIHHQLGENENTLLMYSCRNKDEDDILFLYEKGADFFVENIIGKSAYDILIGLHVLSPKLQSLKEMLILSKENILENEFNRAIL